MFKRCISKILTDGISPKYEAGNFYRRFLAGLQRRAGLLCQLVIFEPTRRRSAARFGLCRRRRGWRRFNFGFDSLLLAGKFRLAPLEPRARTDPGRQLSRSEFYQFAGHSVGVVYFYLRGDHWSGFSAGSGFGTIVAQRVNRPHSRRLFDRHQRRYFASPNRQRRHSWLFPRFSLYLFPLFYHRFAAPLPTFLQTQSATSAAGQF